MELFKEEHLRTHGVIRHTMSFIKPLFEKIIASFKLEALTMILFQTQYQKGAFDSKRVPT
jgi:hypothetical protein